MKILTRKSHKNIVAAFLIFVALFCASFTQAALFVNEVMFNPAGSDTGREWFEVCNGSDSEVLLDGFSFKESGSSHNLSLKQGSDVLQAEECFIVSSDDKLFKIDYPDYSGTLYDSYFTLNNSEGEKIEIFINDSLQDSVIYPVESVEEGYSVSKNGDIFLISDSSPGSVLFANPSSSEVFVSSDSQRDSGEAISSVAELPIYKFKTLEIEPPQDIFIRVPKELKVHAHEILQLPVEVFDARGRALKQVALDINWGDFRGDFASKAKLFEHTYKLPGTYLIKIDAKLDTLADQKVTQVTVFDPKLELYMSKKDKRLLFKNLSDTELNLNKWRLSARGIYKVLPAALLAPKSSLTVNLEDIFSFSVPDELVLLSPDGFLKVKAQSVRVLNTESEKEQKSVQDIKVEKREVVMSNEIKSSAAEKASKDVDNIASLSAQRSFKASSQSILGMRVSDMVSMVQKNPQIRKAEVKTKNINEAINNQDIKERFLAQSISYEDKIQNPWLSFVFFIPLSILFLYLLYLFRKDDFDDWDFEEG